MALQKINEIAKKAGIDERFLEPYGFYKAKINTSINETLADKKDGNLILVTAISPTKAGEGKTTTSIALADGFARINEKALLCLREPALGPVFGIKGGATGGGKAVVEPQEEINLHFTGDMHALTSSINLISAIIDNSIFQGNPLNIDPNKVVWTRAIDMNDRALREVTVAQGEKNGTPRKDGFTITVASELMAILCLAKDEGDFCARLKRIIVAYTYDDKPVTVGDLKVSHAVMRLMKEALKPNLVQTGEGNPVLIHGGPFANIAHGCNSLIATKTALKLAPNVITEAGFAADLGAEKFLDIVCQIGNIRPSLCVMVASIRALKLNGGMAYEDLGKCDIEALRKGIANLEAHLSNIAKFKVPVIVSINHFASDNPKEVDHLEKWCVEHNYQYSFLDSYLKGGEGAIDLARKCLALLKENKSQYAPIYSISSPLKTKIETICKEIYHADKVEYSDLANEELERYEKMGFSNSYICVAKTPNSFSDDPSLLGAPKGFTIHVRDVKLAAGSNFVIPLTGKVMTMPGLPKVPAAVKMEDEPW